MCVWCRLIARIVQPVSSNFSLIASQVLVMCSVSFHYLGFQEHQIKYKNMQHINSYLFCVKTFTVVPLPWFLPEPVLLLQTCLCIFSTLFLKIEEHKNVFYIYSLVSFLCERISVVGCHMIFFDFVANPCDSAHVTWSRLSRWLGVCEAERFSLQLFSILWTAAYYLTVWKICIVASVEKNVVSSKTLTLIWILTGKDGPRWKKAALKVE